MNAVLSSGPSSPIPSGHVLAPPLHRLVQPEDADRVTKSKFEQELRKATTVEEFLFTCCRWISVPSTRLDSLETMHSRLEWLLSIKTRTDLPTIVRDLTQLQQGAEGSQIEIVPSEDRPRVLELVNESLTILAKLKAIKHTY